MENKMTGMYNPVPHNYRTNTDQIGDNLANNMNTVDKGQQKMDELVLYKIFTYGTFLGMLGLLILTFVNFFVNNTREVIIDGICTDNSCNISDYTECIRNEECPKTVFEESTKSTLGLILQLLLAVVSGLSICLKVGFNCTFASIIKLIIVVYGLLLGALTLAGEFIPVPVLAGLAANENDTAAGVTIGFLDVGISVIGLFMMIAYHYVSSTSTSHGYRTI